MSLRTSKAKSKSKKIKDWREEEGRNPEEKQVNEGGGGRNGVMWTMEGGEAQGPCVP